MIRRRFPALPPNIRQTLALVAAIAGIIALVILAASLNSLVFSPGIQYETELATGNVPTQGLAPVPWSLVQALLIIFGVLFLISLLVVLRDKNQRRKTLRSVGLISLYLLIFLLLASIYEEKPPVEEQPLQTEPASGSDLVAPGSEDVPLPAPVIPEPEVRSWVGYIVTLAVLGAAGGLGYWYWKKNRRTELDLRNITLAALSDLSSGRKWDDVVIQCYAQMSSAAGLHGRGQRPPAMTPAEFARRLEKSGLPVQPVRSLTRLFEKARYGSRGSTTNEAEAARACLTAILAALEQHSDA